MQNDILHEASHPVELKCPTCGCSVQESPECRRCKTDLRLIKQTAAYAWKLRDQARRFLLKHDYDQALTYAQKAQAFHRTTMGEWLIQLACTGIEKRLRDRNHLQTLLFP